MKEKTALTLMEQAIMLLILAVAAALCLQAFVWADAHSRENSDRDRALTQLQSAAEVLKACRGDWEDASEVFGGQADENSWSVCWDENWERTDMPGVYRLDAVPVSGTTDYLGCADLELRQEDGTVLGSLQVCWQEVQP